MSDLNLKPQTLAAMIALIERDVISGKIAKQLLPDLLRVMPFCSLVPSHARPAPALMSRLLAEVQANVGSSLSHGWKKQDRGTAS